MSLGYEVCIHRNGRWEVYSFFDSDQENDAIYQARDISNNYQSVCVLWPSEMRIIYFSSKNKSDKKPSYMDVRSDLKFDQKMEPKAAKIIRTAPKPKPTVIEAVETDPHFTDEDKKNAVYLTVGTALAGLIISATIPALLGNLDSTVQALIFFFCFVGSMLASGIVYQVSEEKARLKNQQQDYEHDASWKLLGLSDEVLQKLKEEKSAEVKKALEDTMPSVTNEINTSPIILRKKEKLQKIQAEQNEKDKETQSQTHKASTNSESQSVSPTGTQQKSTEETPESDEEKSARIEESIKTMPKEFTNSIHNMNASSNANLSLPPELDDFSDQETDAENPLAETSLQEILNEMHDAIKAISYIPEKMELKENHEIAATLYLAGGASYIVNNLNLSTKLLKEKIPLILTRLDVNPNRSTEIINQLGHFIRTPRHAIMFDKGVTDAKLRSENSEASYSYENALEKWIKLNQEDDINSFFSAVLFTDIENFTEQTEKNGEAWMIDVLHANNDIIRKIIKAFSGYEIKHTGDGVLATFSNIHKALHAAITIQRGIEIFCKSMPNRAFNVRIGINAGDIVSIDNDIFGAPVNLASRIMNKIDGGEIAISENVHGITQDSDFTFKDKGKLEMKGLEPQHVYTLNWKEGNQKK